MDADALRVCRENVSELLGEAEAVSLVQADVATLGSTWRTTFDTVLLNPPFGTKNNNGLDVQFLKVRTPIGIESAEIKANAILT